LRENRESPVPPDAEVAAGRPEKVNRRTSGMYGTGQSDGRVVPAKQPNNDGPVKPSAEVAEGRRPTTGNVLQQAAYRTLRRKCALFQLRHVREAAPRLCAMNLW